MDGLQPLLDVIKFQRPTGCPSSHNWCMWPLNLVVC